MPTSDKPAKTKDQVEAKTRFKEADGEQSADALEQMTYRVVSNPLKTLHTVRFRCGGCCAEIERKVVSYSNEICGNCHRPMTRLKSWSN